MTGQHIVEDGCDRGTSKDWKTRFRSSSGEMGGHSDKIVAIASKTWMRLAEVRGLAQEKKGLCPTVGKVGLWMMVIYIYSHKATTGTLQCHRIQIRGIKTGVGNEVKPPLIEELDEGVVHKPRVPAAVRRELEYRLRREPPTGEIEYLPTEFKIPSSVNLKDLNLEVGEDRLVLDSKGLFELVEFFLPCSVDQEVIDAQLTINVYAVCEDASNS